MMNKKYCVIVDAYSTTAFLPAEFKKLGYDCIHVTSPDEATTYYTKSFRPEDFTIVVQEKDFEAIMEILQPLPIVGVVAGSDAAGVVADKIAQRLGLSHNDMALSLARRQKDLMAEQLAKAHLAHITHLKSSSSEEIIAWANQGKHWPIIIKPVDGAATEGLTICRHEDDVSHALEHLFQIKSFLGHHFHTALAQPFLQGEEYIVNTVSCEGKHTLSDIWASKKLHDGYIIYDRVVLLPSQGPIQKTLTDYIFKVIDALGISSGPVHCELMLTAKGPVLIEANCRIMGLGIPPAFQEEALDHTQISLTAEAAVDKQKFFAHSQTPYTLKKQLVCVLHQVPYENAFVFDPAIALIKNLPSFRMHKFIYKGGALPQTIDLLTSPGWVLLAHEDMAVIEADIKRLREIEHEDLFMTQPPPCIP